MLSLSAFRPVVAGLVLLAGLAGCSTAPAPQAWAGAVCRALAPWRQQIGDLAKITQEQMTAGTTPPQAKENLVRLFDGARAASETALRGVHRAGVPDVERGADIAARFEHTLASTRDAYGHARDSIAKLSTDSSDTFYDGVATAVTTLQKEYDAGQLDPAKLESKELRQAFDADPDCQ